MPRELQDSLVEAGISPSSAQELSQTLLRVDTSGRVIGPNEAVYALAEATEEVLANPTSTTVILTGAGEYFAYRCTVAAGNITVYDNTAASGKVLVPTTALAVGTFPVFGAGIGRSLVVGTGITVVLSGAATVYISRLAY